MLAQIPDVGPPSPGADTPGTQGHGRLISPGLSAKILLGGGLLLLLVAVMPLVFGRKADSDDSSTKADASPKHETSAGEALLAPEWEGKASQSIAKREIAEAAPPAEKNDASAAAGVSGQAGMGYGGPQAGPKAGPIPPPVANTPVFASPPDRPTRHAAVERTAGVGTSYPSTEDPIPPQGSAQGPCCDLNRRMAVGDGRTGPGDYDPAVYRHDYQRDPRAGYRADDTAESRRAYPDTYPPDTRTADPAYRGDQPRYAATRNDPNAYRRDDPNAYRSNDPNAYRRDDPNAYRSNDPNAYRRDDPNAYRPDEEPYAYRRDDPNAYRRYDPNAYRPEQADTRLDGRGSYDRGTGPVARVADRRQDVAPRYPVTAPPAADEPGVARFKGTIEKLQDLP